MVPIVINIGYKKNNGYFVLQVLKDVDVDAA